MDVFIKIIFCSVPPGVFIAKTFDESLKISEDLVDKGEADEVFVFGGHGLFKAALEQKTYPVRLYYTHIMKYFDSDVFFPPIDWKSFKEIK